MRYISAPHRSHFVASSDEGCGADRRAENIGVTTSLTGGLSTPALYRPTQLARRPVVERLLLQNEDDARDEQQPARQRRQRHSLGFVGGDFDRARIDNRVATRPREAAVCEPRDAKHHEEHTDDLQSAQNPQPTWLAMNHKPMIDTGTPSNHATPYFMCPSSE